MIQPEERLKYLMKLDMHAEAADLAFQLKNLEVQVFWSAKLLFFQYCSLF